jgi:transcriptional regulator with XRE-family HTH domain
VPTGDLSTAAVGQSVILVDESITMGLATFELTKGARRHDDLFPGCGGAIGAGLPHALGAAIAKRLGIAQPRVSEITRGKVDLLSLDYLVGLCAKAGIPVGLKVAA